jgi:hypothetical protein
LLFLTLALASCAKGPTDESIGQTLKAGFFSDAQLKNEPIQIAVVNGEVTLSGELSSDAARLQAYKLSNETPGVKRVIDSMTVKSAQPAQTAQVTPKGVAAPPGPRSAASAAKVPKTVEPAPQSSGPEPAEAGCLTIAYSPKNSLRVQRKKIGPGL